MEKFYFINDVTEFEVIKSKRNELIGFNAMYSNFFKNNIEDRSEYLKPYHLRKSSTLPRLNKVELIKWLNSR